MSKARDIASASPAPSTVSATELGYLDGVTSAVQTQIDSKIGQSTAINPTIVDAKGDIIAATAADTVSRLAVGSNNQVLTADSSTATGLKWATADALPSQTSKTGKFLSTNGTTASWQSADGSVSDWSFYLPAANPTANSFSAPNGVMKVNGYWFIVSGNGFISYSSDAKSWTRWASTGTEAIVGLQGVLYANNIYVFYGDSGAVFTATTIGGTLTSRTSQFSTSSILDGVWMGGSVNLFILVGGTGKVSTSPDGINWTARTANQSTNTVGSIAVNDTGTLAILAATGSIANNASYSSDGINWTAFSPDDGSTANRNGFMFYDAANTKWIYAGNYTQWWESTNPTGGTWTQTIRTHIDYGNSSANNTDKSNLYAPFISKDVTNNKWIVISQNADGGTMGIYTYDPTSSVSIDSGKVYKLDNFRTFYVPTNLGKNTYAPTVQVAVGYADGVFVACGGSRGQVILSNA
jgi:hypothetical protein